MLLRNRFRLHLLALPGLLAVGQVFAEDVSESDRIICAIQSTTICVEADDCYDVSPLDLDVPQFLIIDRNEKTLSTTKNAPRQRSTKVNHLSSVDGRLLLQGIERGRAYSFVIEEDLGLLTAALARDGVTLSAFGACTDADSH